MRFDTDKTKNQLMPNFSHTWHLKKKKKKIIYSDDDDSSGELTTHLLRTTTTTIETTGELPVTVDPRLGLP
jgi:hypothetical protein